MMRIWVQQRLDAGSAMPVFHAGRGCHHCNNTGYRGRLGVYELLEIDGALAAALAMERALAELNRELAAEGKLPLAIGVGVNNPNQALPAVVGTVAQAANPKHLILSHIGNFDVNAAIFPQQS